MVAGPCAIEGEGILQNHRDGGQGCRAHLLRVVARSNHVPVRMPSKAWAKRGWRSSRRCGSFSGDAGRHRGNGFPASGHRGEIRRHVLQIGARNMQNFDLLKEVGQAPLSPSC
jgi:hypothetical protein